jgi:hypothetical protein
MMTSAKHPTLVVLAGVFSLIIGCATHRHSCCPPQPVVCPKCNHHCKLDIEKVKEATPCFEVECEAICIPHVKLPWHDCCDPPRCARTRLVNVLVEKEYECEVCKYKWTPVCCEKCGAGKPDAD